MLIYFKEDNSLIEKDLLMFSLRNTVVSFRTKYSLSYVKKIGFNRWILVEK